MAGKGFARNIKPLQILTEEQVEAIHTGTLGVLENTGVRFEHEEALKLFQRNGCKVDFSDMRARIPGGLVEECLRQVPGSFRMKARDPQNDLQIGGDTLHFTTFPGMQTVDLDTWEPRAPTRKEFYDAVTVLDALDGLHFITSFSPWYGYEGVPPAMCMLEGTAAKIRCSTKVQKEGYLQDSEVFTLKMGKVIGTNIGLSVNPSPPLTYYRESCEVVRRAVEADSALFIVSGGLMGGTAPATVAGATITSNAEVIAGTVLAQLMKPGTPIVVGGLVFPQDMRGGSPVFGAIECALFGATLNQYFKRFDIPTYFVSAGVSNSKRIDFQCGYEKAMVTLLGALCGFNIIAFYGGLSSELTAHPLQAILDDDIAGMVGRFLEGVAVNQETLATDLIGEVGPIPGFYLDKAHTRNWWKKEQFLPRVADRLTYPEWMEAGKKSALDYARERMEEILATHKPTPLTSEQDAELERILEEAREHYEEKGLL